MPFQGGDDDAPLTAFSTTTGSCTRIFFPLETLKIAKPEPPILHIALSLGIGTAGAPEFFFHRSKLEVIVVLLAVTQRRPSVTDGVLRVGMSLNPSQKPGRPTAKVPLYMNFSRPAVTVRSMMFPSRQAFTSKATSGAGSCVLMMRWKVGRSVMG